MADRQTTINDSRSFGEVVGDLVGNAQEVVRGEIRLAKAEIREEISTATKASAMLAAGVVFGLYAFGMLLFTIVWALDNFLELWLSALIVTAVMAVIAGILVAIGRSRLQQVQPKPDETIDSMKENVEWIKRQKP